MPKNNHTPGPWKSVELKTDYLIKTRDGCVIAHVRKFSESAPMAPQALPNARLINNAPKLLAALKQCYMVLYGDGANTFEEQILVDGTLFLKGEQKKMYDLLTSIDPIDHHIE